MGEQMAMLERARLLLRDFMASRRGNVAMMFGLALVPMAIAGGVALDYSRAAIARSQMSEALDAASLAVGSSSGLDEAKALDLAKKYFEANYHGDGKPDVTLEKFEKNKVVLSAKTSVDTTLLKIISNDPMTVSTSSTVVWGQTKLWVSLVLDNSTSMNEGSPTTKMSALQAASKKLLAKLKTAAATPGDVKVALVPFTALVAVDKAKVTSGIYWGDWEAQPPNALLDGTTDNTGPGSSCPFSNSSHGFRCQQNPANGASTTSTIPSSGSYKGYICPTYDTGAENTDRYDRYYNGCWTSTATQTKTEVKTETTPVWVRRRQCSQTGSGTINCNNSSNANYPAATPVTTTAPATITPGYTGDSTVVGSATTDTGTEYYEDGSKSCSGKGNNRTCTWTRFYYNKKTQDTTTKTGVGPWKHAWVVNDHSTWTGCIQDRKQDYDIQATVPDSSDKGFPATNHRDCFDAKITTLEERVWTSSSVWTDLDADVDKMKPDGYTNQPIGVAHGMQMLIPGAPYGTLAVPSNTSRYIILFSDGLNTRNRWWDDLQYASTGSTRINTRMEGVCDAAKAEGIVIYSVYVHIGGLADSEPMRKCASGDAKYYNLTSVDQIEGAFQDIAQKITSVRVAQ